MSPGCDIPSCHLAAVKLKNKVKLKSGWVVLGVKIFENMWNSLHSTWLWAME